MNVILAEDDLDIQLVARLALKRAGFTVTVVGNGLEAIEAVQQHTPDVILLDWMMPRCDGATFRREQLKDPHIAGIPVILLSADGRLDQKMKDVGAISCLKKPVDLDALLDTVEKYARSA